MCDVAVAPLQHRFALWQYDRAASIYESMIGTADNGCLQNQSHPGGHAGFQADLKVYGGCI